MNKRGLSNVLAITLIILIVIIAIILIWIYLRQSITESSERVEMEGKCYTLEVDLQNCEYGGPLSDKWFVSGIVKLKEGDPLNIRVAFYDEMGGSKTRDVTLINILETKKILPPTKMEKLPVYAIASPIVFNRDKTKNMVCPISRRVLCNKIDVRGNLCDIPTSIEDIEAFIYAIDSNSDYDQMFPSCARNNSDFSCDGGLDFSDADYFSQILENGWVLCNRQMICERVNPGWLTNQTAVEDINATCS